MPRTIIAEDGSQIEVPTDEELAALKTKATQFEDANKKIADLQNEINSLKNDPIEKNWRLIREKNETLVRELQKQGKSVNEDGTIVEAPKSITPEEIEQKARKAAREEMLAGHKVTMLSKYADEQRKVVEHYYNKLTSGEEVTVENMEKFMKEAELIAFPNSSANNTKRVTPNGQPPILKSATEGNSFGDSDEGKKLANEIFGGLSYGNPKK